MRLKNLAIKILRAAPENTETAGHVLALRGGYIHQTGAGLYTFSPLGLKVLRNIEEIIREKMNAVGCQEILMPMVSPANLWVESGRYDSVDVLLKFKTRAGVDSVLNPTHEEIVCEYARSLLQSYRQLPMALYQIQSKYRDELRVRAGLVRCREFIMKDAYSFHRTREDLEDFYSKMLEAYHEIYRKIGIENVLDVVASVGTMGGRVSHEFQMISPIGEDTLYICAGCNYRCNRDIFADSGGTTKNFVCPLCGDKLEETRGVEVGNIFQLGDRYSNTMNIRYSDEQGKKCTPTMGCYGIGLGRAMACIMEQAGEGNGKIWNMAVAPYKIHLIVLGNSEKIRLTAEKLYQELLARHIDVILDDSTDGAGSKFANADLLGSPIVVLVSEKNISNGVVEVKYGRVRGDYPKTLLLEDAVKNLCAFTTLDID
jgi:prolyl-tRNA synthetase